MDHTADPSPLLPSRGVLRIEDFCRHTGLDEDEVVVLMRSDEVDSLWKEDGRPFGIFDDALPTPEHLRALGLAVSESYDPERLRSHEEPRGGTNGPVAG